MSTMQADLVRGTIAEVKQLTVDKLKRILKNENLPVGGLKSELQTRLVARRQFDPTSPEHAILNQLYRNPRLR